MHSIPIIFDGGPNLCKVALRRQILKERGDNDFRCEPINRGLNEHVERAVGPIAESVLHMCTRPNRGRRDPSHQTNVSQGLRAIPV